MKRLLATLALVLLLVLSVPAAALAQLSIYTPTGRAQSQILTSGTSFTVPGGVKVVKPQAVKEG